MPRTVPNVYDTACSAASVLAIVTFTVFARASRNLRAINARCVGHTSALALGPPSSLLWCGVSLSLPWLSCCTTPPSSCSASRSSARNSDAAAPSYNRTHTESHNQYARQLLAGDE